MVWVFMFHVSCFGFCNEDSEGMVYIYIYIYIYTHSHIYPNHNPCQGFGGFGMRVEGLWLG